MKIDVIKDSIVVLLGNAILALGVSFFIIPNDILTGGLPGIAIALEPVFHWNPTLVIDFLTVFFFVVGAIFFWEKICCTNCFEHNMLSIVFNIIRKFC